MAQRYTESDKWTKNQWFRELPPKFKLFWLYLWDSVDFTGVYEVDIKLASFLSGNEYELEEIETVFNHKIYKISAEKWFIPEYLLFQYPNGINSNHAAVKSLRKKLMRLSLIDKVRERLGENYVKKEVIGADYKLLSAENNVNVKLTLDQPLDNVDQSPTDKDTNTAKEKETATATVNKTDTYTEIDEREFNELRSIDMKKEYPVLGELKDQLTVEQMKLLLIDKSVAQIEDALKKVCSNPKEFLGDSVFDSIEDYFENGTDPPF